MTISRGTFLTVAGVFIFCSVFLAIIGGVIYSQQIPVEIVACESLRYEMSAHTSEGRVDFHLGWGNYGSSTSYLADYIPSEKVVVRCLGDGEIEVRYGAVSRIEQLP